MKKPNSKLTDRILRSTFEGIFDKPIIDNAMRGYFCEYMIAEALGDECQLVGAGWHPWDLQIGPSEEELPNRIRIQVKNSARLQLWTHNNHSDCSWSLKARRKPSYYDQYYPDTPCEDLGFLCDLFILCLHDITDLQIADQRDPEQWKFYLVPVVGKNRAVTQGEYDWLINNLKDKATSSLVRKPHTLERGIRGRQPIAPAHFKDLSTKLIKSLF